jgi:cation diffusion facilitator CzcD-associated flavoprotein CzcO
VEGGPKTYLGVMVEGFPNMMMLMGPHRAGQHSAHRIQRGMGTGRSAARDQADARRGLAAGVASWTDHVRASAGLLSNEVNSWMTGINTNVGGQTRIIAR